MSIPQVAKSHPPPLQAAEAGDTSAMFYLGRMYMDMGGVEGDVISKEVDALVGSKGRSPAVPEGGEVRPYLVQL